LEGLFMFGDPNQLKPIVISNMANEAAHVAQLSPPERKTRGEQAKLDQEKVTTAGSLAFVNRLQQ